MLDGGQSANIELDALRKTPVTDLPYIETIDRVAFENELRGALHSAPLVVVQGAIVWPLVEGTLGFVRTRRVYLKRMMRNRPDFWADEDFIYDPEWWSSHEPRRSIHQYQARQRPWEKADLVLERIEEETTNV